MPAHSVRTNLVRYSCCQLVFAIAIFGVGCSVSAPVHYWQPPLMQSAVGKRVALTTVAGPEETAGPIKQELLSNVPSDKGRSMAIFDAQRLAGESYVQLVSAVDNEPNDVAIASAARRADVDMMLRGQIIERLPQADDAEPGNRRLGVSWKLTPVDGQGEVGGKPIVVDLKSAVERYPDLALQSDIDRVLVTAVVRETYRLVTPSIEKTVVELANPGLTLGSSEVRRGNQAAIRGQWEQAEQIWMAVLDKHPLQVAAMHNLALAAAASQDFSRARELARRAVRYRPIDLHKQTLAWIELRQRDYHNSFNLPDPPEGWFMTK